jgi:hypothetical protein
VLSRASQENNKYADGSPSQDSPRCNHVDQAATI